MNGSLRVLLLTPGVLPQVSGNAVTAERWRSSLSRLGHKVLVVSADGISPIELVARTREFIPHVIHAHHAFKSGRLVLEAELASIPLIISPAGTDLSLDLQDRERGGAVREALQRARRIVVQGTDASRRIEEILPARRGQIVVVPKALSDLGDEPWDLRNVCGVRPEELVFLHPAGVRPVKGNLEVLRSLAELHRCRPGVRAVFLGPALDPAYAARFETCVGTAPFAHWLPGVAPEYMPGAYRAADVVLNASRAEGLANVLLEAAAAAVPVLASDIPSNREVVAGLPGEEPGGLLYPLDDPRGFLDQALRLVDDPQLRQKLGRAGLARARRWPRSDQEAAALVDVYRSALDGEAQPAP